jgi:hypothetical protein
MQPSSFLRPADCGTKLDELRARTLRMGDAEGAGRGKDTSQERNALALRCPRTMNFQPKACNKSLTQAFLCWYLFGRRKDLDTIPEHKP